MIGRISIGMLLFTGITRSGIAQTQDYPDYRNKKEGFARVTDKSIRADLGVFSIGGLEESIGKIPLKKISPYSSTKTSMSFKGDNIEVTVTTGQFESAGRKITKSGNHVVKIDNKPFYGDYGAMPRSAIKSVTILINKDTVVIPPAAYADLYNLNFTYKDKTGTERTSNGIFFSADGKRMYIYLQCRDYTGSYEVTWIFQDKKYLRRVLDWGFTQ